MSNVMFAPSYDQLSLFCCENTGIEAVSLFDGKVDCAHEPDAYMKRLIPKGSYYVMVGEHPLVLTKTTMTSDTVPAGHEFYHYMIDGDVYAGTFVGKEES